MRSCVLRGHQWRQKVANVLGERVCRHCGRVEVDPAALPPEEWVPVTSPEPAAHDAYTHREDGRVCILVEDGTWFVPLDAGGEGYPCERQHGPAYEPVEIPVLDVHAADQGAEAARYAAAVQEWQRWLRGPARDERAAGWDQAHTTLCSKVPCNEHHNPFWRSRGATGAT